MDCSMKELEEGNANDVMSSLCLKKFRLGEMDPSLELKQSSLEHFFKPPLFGWVYLIVGQGFFLVFVCLVSCC